MNDIAVLERLVQAGEVLDLLTREYDRRGDYANVEVCKRAALDMLVSRLRNGHAKAWSTNSNIDSSIDTGSVTPDQIVATWDYHHHTGFPAEVPQEFWSHFYHAGQDNRSFDPVSGDFQFSYSDNEYSSREGNAYDVWLDPRGLPSLAVPTRPAPAIAPSQEPTAMSLPASTARGRPAANWWPDFAAELAIYVHEEGLPDGSDTEGQGAVIDAVLSRLAERGAREPSRASIQPVVNDILRRIRAARN